MTTTEKPAQDEFLALAQPYRRELMAHCYRMLGSVHDAEDVFQETMVRAWRGYDRFEGRSSLRTWLHRIATSTCLTALEGRKRRPMPAGLNGTGSDPDDPLRDNAEVAWLEPVPDHAVGADPAAVVSSRSTIRLAFVAALQHLPARQRAVLLLREVLQWKASEVAELLGTSVAAVNSALQRARAQMAQVAPAEDDVAYPLSEHQRDLLERYVAAFEIKDVAGIVALLAADVVWEMPPYEAWYRGREHVAQHLRTRCPAGPGDLRLVPISANGQPGFAQYLRGPDGVFRPFNLQVLTFTGTTVAHVATFLDPSLFDVFDLPPEIRARPSTSGGSGGDGDAAGA
ncbi:sigma-70 family RNA polymerase sigma factor [Pseudonocardia sp.]|uniref:sigma-70 family RNA polymerase sigma factor n=1 Tax=Pseudonocardia sp. TaxID=60912 RepID=UPI002630F18A|nr:sigma-70 family RNA polymerase sigma factor [Pseudonocardia sp.]